MRPEPPWRQAEFCEVVYTVKVFVWEMTELCLVLGTGAKWIRSGNHG